MPLTFQLASILARFATLYASALQEGQAPVYLSALRTQCVYRLVIAGLDRERAALEVDECCAAILADIDSFTL